MQQRRTNSYSDVKTQLEIDLEEERQALLEDQKLCRIRTQKLSIETNRRRKALEEKRRDEEEKEQRFREEILQQRKIKLQEATEKFQRAHLPPSQRRRTVYIHKKIPPKLEDALDQIQGSSSSYYLHNHKSRPVDAPSSSANGTWNRKQQPSSMLGADRIHQDRNITQSGSNQCYFQHKLEEAQRLLEEHHISNIQKFHKDAEQLAHSESLSSLDSLEDEADTGKAENGALEEFTSNNLQKALSEVLPYSVNTDAVLSTQPYGNESRQSNTISSFETVDHNIATNKLLQKSKHISNMTGEQIVTFIQNGTATSENKHNYLQDEERKMNKSEQRTALSEHRESATSNLVVKPCKAWATPDPTPREAVQNVVPQENKETIQHLGIYIKPTVSQPLATPTVIPLTEWEGSASTSNDGVHTNSKNSKYPDDIKSVAGTDSMAGANNAEFHLVKNDRPKYAETTNQALRMHENTYINSSMANKVFGINQDQKDQVLKAAVFHDDTNCGHAKQYKKDRNTIGVVEGARLLKSILKKDSKYENAFSKIGFNKTLHFGNKSAPYIRDSVELTKEKEQLFENQKAGNKKLRWLDEIDKIMIEKSVAGSKMNLAGNVFFSEHPDSVNHQGYVFAPKSTLVDQREPPSGTQSSIYSTGYHLAKQAWTPSKGEETSSVGHNQIRNSPPKAKTKLVRRPKSAKTQTTLVHKNRKGIIIRPQSATEASMIIKAQGKLMTPHPPSKPASGFQNRHNAMEGIVPNYTDNANVNISSSIMLPSNQVFTRDTIAKAISYQNLVHPSANLVTAQKYNSNGLGASSKSLLTLNNDQALILQENLQTSSKRHHVYGENGLRLDHTPTDEEIALLWQGVRSALTHKNVAAGDFYPGDLPSNLQPTRPNLSHVVIDGGNLLGGLKTYSRINGLYSAANNGYTTLARRKQILDSTENKRRALLEQRRWKAGPATWTSTQNLHTMKINPFPSAFEPGQTLHGVPNPNEVTESTAQFMLAENLVDTSATDGEILAAMQAMQANKQSFLIHKTQHIGLSALSLEEQKILQSLDRLNHRLHNVHETIGRTQTIRPPLNIQQFMSQNSDTSVPSQRFRSKSADPRTQLQRRY